MFLCRFLLLNLFFVFLKCESFDEFYKYVSKTISDSASYTLPTNNGHLYLTNNDSVKDFGKWDFIIVGGGSAGSLLAGRLSEIRKWKILLLEAGENQTRFTDIPAMYKYSLQSNKNWGYFTTPQTTACLGMVNNSCSYPRGKVLGGTAAINGVMNARGIPDDYDNWAKLGNQGWSYNEVLPYFKSFEKVDFPNADPNFYGCNGKIHVNFTFPPSEIAEAFLNANIQSGSPQIDYNGNGIQGVSRSQFHLKGNKRDNSAHAFVDSAQKRPNLKIELEAFVTKILVLNKKAYGVRFIKNGQTYIASVDKEVILSAGAINSPQILLLSGIGPSSELLSNGIKPLNNLPAVGKHLKDHPTFANLIIRTNQTVPYLSLKENLQRYIKGMTPFTNGAFNEQLAFINTKNNSPYLRDIELMTYPPPFGVPEKNNHYNKRTDIFMFVVVLKPKSEGSVTLKSASPLDFPLIDVRPLSDSNNEDIETMYRGIQYVIKLTETPAFQKLNASYLSIQPKCEHLKGISDRKYWYCAIRYGTSPGYHPIGTTRMGVSPEDSVVDTNLKVHNMKNLRVVDAGVMPDLITGHTNSPTYMIAEKISYRIKFEYGINLN